MTARDEAVTPPTHLSEPERAVRAIALGVLLGAVMSLLGRRR